MASCREIRTSTNFKANGIRLKQSADLFDKVAIDLM